MGKKYALSVNRRVYDAVKDLAQRHNISMAEITNKVIESKIQPTLASARDKAPGREAALSDADRLVYRVGAHILDYHGDNKVLRAVRDLYRDACIEAEGVNPSSENLIDLSDTKKPGYEWSEFLQTWAKILEPSKRILG